MKNRNEMLKAAFEEAERTELERLPGEDKIIRPYSEDFRNRMDALLGEDKKEADKKKRFHFGRIAVVAAVLVALFSFTTSALLKDDAWARLFNLKPDPEKYQTVEVEASEAYENDEVFVEKAIEYTGEPISLKYSVDTGETWNWPDQGIMVFIDGVKQVFSVKNADGEQKNIEMLHLQNEAGTEREFEITLQPNVGKKGDEMYLSIVAVFDPYVNFYTQCDFEYKQLNPMHYDDNGDWICEKCTKAFNDATFGAPSSLTHQSEAMFKLIMKKDAPTQTAVVEKYSGLKTDKLDKLIYDSYEYEDGFGEKFNEYDTIEALVAEIYKDIKDAHYTEWGVSYMATRFETKAKQDDEFTINLYGATGKYRISLYVNNEMQKVFDGAYYTDVHVKHGQQAELTVNIDTSKLPEGSNFFYVVYERLDGEPDIFRQVDTGWIYTVEVK